MGQSPAETGRYRPARRLVVLLLTAVVAAGLTPVAAYGSSPTVSSLSSEAARDRLAEEFSAVLSFREGSDSMCLSVNLDDELILESRSHERLVPASLMKVATATAALEVMSPDEVYSTQVFVRTDALQSVTGGVLSGDLYLRGGGDPVLSTPRYVNRYSGSRAHTDITKLADRVFAFLSAHGVTRIEGGLVGDDSWYPDRERDYSQELLSEGPVWKSSFVTFNNSGPLSALLVNSGYSSYSGSPSQRGNARAADPARHAAAVFDDLLEARGMVITRRPTAAGSPAARERTLLGAVESPPLGEILARMLSYSDNTIAEMLLKEIGRRTGGSDRASAAAGAQAILRQKLGPLADGLVITDGSGLSSHNRLTCAAVAEMLRLAGPGSPLVEGLSVAGEVGSLRNCAPVPSPAGNDGLNVVRAKTGTLNDVSALAGAAVAPNGEIVTFAMIVNKPLIILLGGCNRLRRTILNAAANYVYGPPDQSVSHPGDRAALVALFENTGGDSWFNSWGWNTDAPLGQWHGVVTDSAGRVTELDLGGPFGGGLTGRLPELIGQLSELTRLDLSGNRMEGSLPHRISDLTKLRELRISGTGLCLPREPAAGVLAHLIDPSVETCSFFVDATGNFHVASLEALTQEGILDGTECAPDRICPDDAIQRWTVAVWLVRAIDGPAPPAVGGRLFGDVEFDAWWRPYVERLAELQVTRGCATAPLRFCPDMPVTREQMASFLVRAFDLAAAPAAGFGDTVGDYHETDIDALAAAGITVGCQADPLLYCPTQPVTRAQMATFLARALDLLED